VPKRSVIQDERGEELDDHSDYTLGFREGNVDEFDDFHVNDVVYNVHAYKQCTDEERAQPLIGSFRT
jgi:hypothetical protein